MNRKVNLPGHGTFWFQEMDGSGALAPLEHCDEHGDIKDLPTAVGVHGPSYAHVFKDGTIKRFNQVIGTKADLEETP